MDTHTAPLRPAVSEDRTSVVRRVVRAGGAYDVVVTAGFATPWTAALTLDTLEGLQSALGIGGATPSTDDPMTLLFASLMGSLVMVWSVLRILRPTAELGLADTVARLLFASWMAVALVNGATGLLVAFLVAEIGWAVVQGWAVLGNRATARAATVGA